jgi:hypothetical protein
MSPDPLHAAFDRFLSDRDEAALLAAIAEHGGRAPSIDLDCPVAHRICDVCLGGSGYRVVRVADPDDHTTKLYIYAMDSKALSFAKPGVPFRLQGEALWQWVEDELRSPTEDRVDWSRYDASLGNDA